MKARHPAPPPPSHDASSDAPHRGDTTADRVGQAAEWLLWTELTLTSLLHVFLPLRDMGVDAVVRVPGTDVAVAIQVKSRHVLADGKLHLLVRDSELHDPRATIVAVLAERRDDGALHPQCLLIPTLDLGDIVDEHAGMLSFTWDPDSTRHDAAVAPYRCHTDELAHRIAVLLEL